jgi:hypothetical protein
LGDRRANNALMRGNAKDIPLERMMLAADAIFDALHELGCARLPAHPVALLGSEDQPAAFCDFTRDEMQAASDFLERMDALPVEHDSPA